LISQGIPGEKLEEAEVTIETLGSPDSAVAMPGDEYAPET
jgi:hypothetical protein